MQLRTISDSCVVTQIAEVLEGDGPIEDRTEVFTNLVVNANKKHGGRGRGRLGRWGDPNAVFG